MGKTRRADARSASVRFPPLQFKECVIMFALVRDYRHALLLTGAAASWGIATVISKRAVDEIAPLTLLPVQLAVSVVTLMVLARIQGMRVTWSPQRRRLAALGALDPGISYALSLPRTGSHHRESVRPPVDRGTTADLALARWSLRDPITGPLAITMASAFGGVVLVVFTTGTRGAPVGVALTLAGVAVLRRHAGDSSETPG
jgi:hypothetical protein